MEDHNEAYANVKTAMTKSQVTIKSLIQDILFDVRTQEMLDDYSAKVRDEFKRLKGYFSSLRSVALESEDNITLKSVESEIEEWQTHTTTDRETFRKAFLTAQHAINQRQGVELMTYKETDSKETTRERSKISRSMMKKESNQLTDDLLTVTRMVKDNTEKSAKTVDMLVDGSHTISSTKEELRAMGSVIGQAKKILNKYGRRENTDKLLILLGLIFFLASCLVVVRNRYL